MFLWRCALVAGLLIAGVGVPSGTMAQAVSLLHEASFSPGRGSLFAIRETPMNGSASLFAGRGGASLFAPFPERRSRQSGLVSLGAGASQVARIRALIGRAEAGKRGYDAVQYGAVTLPGKLPTEMTIAEIYRWIERTPGQQHAIGRYQFIPATLRRVVGILGVAESAVFAPQLQDRLADVLLAEAGLKAVQGGEIERHAFMNNMAKIWAGLPTSNGKSHYDGYAGNKATMTWTYFDAEMGRIFAG